MTDKFLVIEWGNGNTDVFKDQADLENAYPSSNDPVAHHARNLATPMDYDDIPLDAEWSDEASDFSNHR